MSTHYIQDFEISSKSHTTQIGVWGDIMALNRMQYYKMYRKYRTNFEDRGL